MRKLMFALVAAGAAAFMAKGEIESANVVGYTTVTFAAGDRYVICGIPFDNTADPEGLSIQDLVPDPLNNGWTGGGSANNADAIQFWNNGQYVTLAMNYLPEDFRIGELRAEYRRQVFLGDTLYPAISHREEGALIVSMNDAEGKPYAVVEFIRN